MFRLAVRMLIPLFIGGALVFGVMKFMIMADEDDRPPIIVSNGSIEIQEADANGSVTTGGRGSLKDVSGATDPRKTWQHDHTARAPKRLHVLVEGADSTIGGNCAAMLFVQNISKATISYSTTSGPRDVVVSKQPGNQPVDISVQKDADVTQPDVYALSVDKPGIAALVSVEIGWGSGTGATSVTCQFGSSPAPRIVFLQTTK